jgi:predicted outer membrane repeat protein
MKKITIMFAFFLMATNLFAIDYYVKTGGVDTALGGTTEETAFATLAYANTKAVDGDTIYIVGAITQNTQITIIKTLTFIGMSDAVITGDAARLFVIPNVSATVTISGKTFSFSNITFQNVDCTTTGTNGYGAVLFMGGDNNLSFTNCTFLNNQTVGNGGALSVEKGNLTITNCTFTGNIAAGQAGAINLIGAAKILTITDSVFSGNSAGNGLGGAIFAAGNSAVAVPYIISVTNSLFVGNSSTKAPVLPATTPNANGGAIHVSNNLRQALISSCTFYNNTTDLQGGALYFAGSNATSKLTNITCFGNKVTLADAVTNRGAGIRVEGERTFVIENSLAYGNLQGTNDLLTAVASDLGVAGKVATVPPATPINGVLITLTNSLFGATTLDDNDVATTSNITANLASSNLTYDTIEKKVIYNAPTTPGENSPIDFGSDGKDAGAWDSGLNLSLKDNEFAANFSVSYHAQTKHLKVIRSNDDSVSLAIYNLMGSKVLSLTNASKEENINASSLQSGVYILVVKGSGNKSFSQKFVIN